MGTFLKIFPYILQSIIAVNELIGRGKGATKKKLVMDAISLGSDIMASGNNASLKLIDKVIDATVQTLNDAGVFETSNHQSNQ